MTPRRRVAASNRGPVRGRRLAGPPAPGACAARAASAPAAASRDAGARATPPPRRAGGRRSADFRGPAPFRRLSLTLANSRKLRDSCAKSGSSGVRSALLASRRHPDPRRRRRRSHDKSEFVDKVAANSGLSKKDAGTAVDAVIKSIEDALSAGEDVTFTGFGKFHVAYARRPRGSQPAHGRDDDDRREQGAALHRGLGPQEGRQVAAPPSPAGRRRTLPAPGRRRRRGRAIRRPARGRGRRARVADRPRDRSRPGAPVAGRGRARTARGARRAGAGAPPRRVARARSRRGARRQRAAAAPPGASGAPARGGRGGARALPRADRRRRPGMRRGQAAARVLRAARLRRLARARGVVRARARARACSCSPTASAATSPVTAAAYAQALVGRDPDAVRRRRRASAPTRSPPTRCSAATRSRRWSTARAPPARGVFVLVRTSNPGAADLLDLALAGGEPLWERLARAGRRARRARAASGLADVGAVTGATAPEHLARMRELMPRDAVPAAGRRRAGRRRRGRSRRRSPPAAPAAW